ncbi:MAG: DUF1501 domain-containing protein [Verrucomicrobia bacterium]|nr:DUF1501 domain-containing protein [Verrucomicrobiota bacterium]
MLSIFGRSTGAFCNGVSRRQFLQIGALGAGVTLADLLRARAALGDSSTKRVPKAAILINLAGGPPHMEMYDPKPDAPAEFRGETGAIRTNVPGVQIGELLPLHARMMDKMSVIRSVIAGAPEHSDSVQMTGYPEPITKLQKRPSVGSVISKVRGKPGEVPAFVSLRPGQTPVGDPFGWGVQAGYLGVSHQPFTPGEGGDTRKNLLLPKGLTPSRLDDRVNLLKSFDTLRRDIDTRQTMEGMDSFQQQALEMVTSGKVYRALDLKNEPLKTLDRYKGVEQFLTARRLVEAGVSCVTFNFNAVVNNGRTVVNWDTHKNHFPEIRLQLPQYDLGVTTLVQDLYDRGLQDDVVVLAWGEFGRTPRINKDAGRDHWPAVMSALIVGGGLKMGQVIGSSSSTAEQPKDRPYTVQQVLATFYQALGIDPAMTFPDNSGRPMYLLDEREPVKELL